MSGEAQARQSDHPIEKVFLERWSPRAFDNTPVAEGDLHVMFEAARWAPSAFNAQPWRFVYALRGDADWDRLRGVLVPFNADWVATAGALVFICSDTMMQGKPDKPPTPSHSHSFDAGAAWALLALQATHMGYHTHGMTGVDFDRARVELEAPERFRVEAAIAIGRQGDKAQLPEGLRDRETPSSRVPLANLVYRGRFGAPAFDG